MLMIESVTTWRLFARSSVSFQERVELIDNDNLKSSVYTNVPVIRTSNNLFNG
jgi:hypothetical protein